MTRAIASKRVFVKLANGSSASGVVALHFAPTSVRAVTTIEMIKQGRSVLFYNNLRLQTYTAREDVRIIVDYLCAESAQIECWMPKASLAGRTFDLRIVVINGSARQTVVRCGSGPMTNLHLGNRRGDLRQLRTTIGTQRWHSIQETAENAARLFRDSMYVGVDLLLTPGFRNEMILELNAFGDLLPGIKSRGQETYATEIAAQLQRIG